MQLTAYNSAFIQTWTTHSQLDVVADHTTWQPRAPSVKHHLIKEEETIGLYLVVNEEPIEGNCIYPSQIHRSPEQLQFCSG